MGSLNVIEGATPPQRSGIERLVFDEGGEFSAFFTFFDYLLSQQNYLWARMKGQAPLTYADIGTAVSLLKGRPQITKTEAIQELHDTHGTGSSRLETSEILNLAVQMMIMVDCDPQKSHAPGFAIGDYSPKSWKAEQTYLDFVNRSFPMDPGPSQGLPTAIGAWKLQKHLGVEFRLTNNLAMHLLYESQGRPCIYLFHQVGWLKAQLKKHNTSRNPLGVNVEECLKRGSPPVQLLYETMHSLQFLLFRRSDNKSVAILEKLTGKGDRKFDPECANYDGYKRLEQEGFTYLYWGERMRKLEEALASPPPRNKLERWLQSQSSDRNALLIALLALFISIFVGLLTVALAAVQTWIAYMAWQYPVK